MNVDRLSLPLGANTSLQDETSAYLGGIYGR